MKKLLIALMLCLCSGSSLLGKPIHFIIKDEMGILQDYEVTPDFLEKFAQFVRSQDREYRPFLADIYNDLKIGDSDIVYNPNTNTISGVNLNRWSSMTAKEASKMYGPASVLDGTFNTKKQRFYKALSRLSLFSYHPY